MPILVLAFLLAQAIPLPRDGRPGPTSGSGTLRGVVIDEETAAPIGGAQVFVTRRTSSAPDASSPFTAETTTSDDGRFELSGLPAGELIVSATPGEHRASHLTSTLGHDARTAFAITPSLELARGEIRSGVTIALPRAAAIEGRVVDEFGEPMANLTVTASPDGMLGGAQSFTDDRGRFRIFGLRSGRYTVCARPEGGWSPAAEATAVGDAAGSTRYGRTCAPGHVAAAADEPPSVRIQLDRHRAYTLSGTIVSGTGADVSLVHVDVMRVDEDGTRAIPLQSRGPSFAAAGVLPGEYLLQAALEAHENGAHELREIAMGLVRVDGADVTGLTLTTVPVASVTARVERDPRASSPLPSRVEPRMLPPIAAQRYEGFRGPSVAANGDGSFTFKGVFGPRVVAVPALPAGWFVAAVRHGDEDITGQAREYRPGDDRGITIVLSDRGATLLARPLGEDGRPRADAYVLLIPADSRRWEAAPYHDFPQRDRDGFYVMRGRAPGDYLVTAVSLDDLRAFGRSGRTLQPLAEAGRRITLVQGRTVTIEVPVTRLEGGR